MFLQKLKNKLENEKILILGFGKEGIDNYLALRKLFPEKNLAIADKLELKNFDKKIQRILKKDKNLKIYLNKNYLNYLKKYELIIKTPGINIKEIKPFLKKKTKLTSQTEIFFEYCPSKIIGVTGTKGKGTTCSLIYQILKKTKINSYLIGNIGTPVFQILLKAKIDDIFIYELSCHQLQNLKKSPHIAVFLNLYPDHLDYYQNLKEYYKAKESIFKYQTKKDYLIFNSEQKVLRDIINKSKAKKIPIKVIKARKDIPKNLNLLDLGASILVAKILKISEKDIRKAIKSFKPLDHRLEFIGKHKGIEFYNDSFATIPEATIFAINTLKNIKTLILGGSKKGEIDFTNLAKEILKNKIENIILFPSTGEEIWKEIFNLSKKTKKLPKKFSVKSMLDAVKIAYKQTQKGTVCLLSPACASFSIFKNYKERGNLFKKYVKIYGKKP
jgi:UDP-N-acetylmuramoylalanine--D-glutamate ligase